MTQPKLILINGPCGIGKSTVAAALHERMPLSYLVDIDAISRNISHGRQYNEERWALRDGVAVVTTEKVLELGRVAVVDKMISSEVLLETFRTIAERHGAELVEIILWAPKDVVMERANARGWRENSLLTPEKCELFWEQINELKERRPTAHLIDVTEMTPDKVLEAVLRLVQ